MGRRRSWAEGRWWRGAKTDPLLAVIFVTVVLFGFPLLMMWRVSPALQRYYTAVYANSCAGSAHMPLVLPYIQWANGARTLASGGQVFALAPASSGAPRFTLSDASVRMGARRLEFFRVVGPAVAQTCAALGSEIQSHQASLKTRIPLQVSVPMLLIAGALVATAYAHRRSAQTIRRGQALRGPELVNGQQFNRLKRGDGVGFVTTERASLLHLLTPPANRHTLAVRSQDES